MWVICPNYGFSSTFYFDLGIAYTDVILSQKGYATLHYITQLLRILVIQLADETVAN